MKHAQTTVSRLFDEFPFDFPLSMELQLLRSFAARKISLVVLEGPRFHGLEPNLQSLVATGDSVLKLARFGYDSETGREVINTVVEAHSQYVIGEEDLQYTLATLAYYPPLWINRFGWRSLKTEEVVALAYLWSEVGHRLGVDGIPVQQNQLKRFVASYEQRNYGFCPENTVLANAAKQVWLRRFPKATHWLADSLLRSVLEPSVLRSVGFREPGKFSRRFWMRLFDLRRYLMQLFPARKSQDWFGAWALSPVTIQELCLTHSPVRCDGPLKR